MSQCSRQLISDGVILHTVRYIYIVYSIVCLYVTEEVYICQDDHGILLKWNLRLTKMSLCVSVFTLLFLTLALQGTTLAQEVEVEPVLRVVPYGIAVALWEVVSLTCSHSPEDLEGDLELEWYLPNSDVPISQQVINETIVNMTSSDILRFSSENGTLTITNSSLSDSGKYSCKNHDGTLEVEAEVKVYIMPSYMTEITVVLVINAVLVLVFLGCYFWSIISERRQKKQQERRANLGHKQFGKT